MIDLTDKGGQAMGKRFTKEQIIRILNQGAGQIEKGRERMIGDTLMPNGHRYFDFDPYLNPFNATIKIK